MAGNSNVKYQVFVSSTYEDLKDERDAVTKAVLEMGHIPVGMEMFSAADEEQWAIIARHIDESDYYAVIVAHRLGSLTPEGISYTRKEYEYARSKGIPCLGFVIDSATAWPADRVDKQTGTQKALQDFKERIQEKPVNFWTDSSDLHSKFSISLMKAMVSSPREGWVRASDGMADKALAAEVARLSAENGTLRGRISELEKASSDEHSATKRETLDTLWATKRTPSYRYTQSAEWHEDVEVSLFQIFRALGPEMLVEADIEYLANVLAMEIRKDRAKDWRHVAYNQVRWFLADLMTLDLVIPSPKRHAVSDTKEYWSLSPLGIEMLKTVRKANLRTSSTQVEPEDSEAAEGGASIGAVKDGSDDGKSVTSSGSAP